LDTPKKHGRNCAPMYSRARSSLPMAFTASRQQPTTPGQSLVWSPFQCGISNPMKCRPAVIKWTTGVNRRTSRWKFSLISIFGDCPENHKRVRTKIHRLVNRYGNIGPCLCQLINLWWWYVFENFLNTYETCYNWVPSSQV